MKYNNLREELRSRGMSVRQCALKSGIIPQSLYAAINGREEFWPGWKKRVAATLKMDESELFEEDHDDRDI